MAKVRIRREAAEDGRPPAAENGPGTTSDGGSLGFARPVPLLASHGFPLR